MQKQITIFKTDINSPNTSRKDTKEGGKSEKHNQHSDFPPCFYITFPVVSQPEGIFRRLSSEVIEHQVLGWNAKVIKHLFNLSLIHI